MDALSIRNISSIFSFLYLCVCVGVYITLKVLNEWLPCVDL